VLPFLIYIATLVHVPHFVFFIAIVYVPLKKSIFRSSDFSNWVFVFILLIIIFSIANFIAHTFVAKKHEDLDIIPYTILMMGSYLIAISLEKKDLKFIVYLVCIECFFGYIQFVLGIKTFFSGIDTNSEIHDNSLLYYRSVFGLSDNSSSFAVKVLLAYLLIYYIGWKGREATILKILLLGGLLVSFNRTSFVAVFLFHGIQFAQLLFKSAQQILSLRVTKVVFFSLVICFFAIAIGIYLVFINYEVILLQLTRSTGEIELTGREQTWMRYANYIQDHLLLGNGSHKYLIYYDGSDKSYHAHNSFLQVFATHGIIIFSLHILLILFNINRRNFIFVIVLVFYSITQYGIFWGISLTDIIFILFLLNKSNGTDSREIAQADT
jgi:hypothetical protein